MFLLKRYLGYSRIASMRCLPRYHILTNLAESENKYRKFACENCHFTAVRFALLLHYLHVNVESITFKQDYLQKDMDNFSLFSFK